MIRIAKSNDLEPINFIRCECGTSEISEYEIRCDDGWITYVSVHNEKVVAYLTIRPQDGVISDDAQFDVFVLPDKQGNGIGSALINHAKKHISESPICNRLTLCVKRCNVNAIHLYSKLGFKEVSRNQFGITMVFGD